MNIIQTAIESLQQGKMVILIDDATRENEGDLVLAAEFATTENINFMLQQTCGVVCLSLTQDRLKQLQLDLAPRHHTSVHAANFTLSIDAAQGVTTGVSAADRVKTIQAVINPHAIPADLATPGHLFPLQAHEQGVLGRGGHTEGSVDLTRIAGLQPAAVICEIMNPDGTMAKGKQLTAFSAQHDIPIISIADIRLYRWQHDKIIQSIACAKLPTELGKLTVHAFRDPISNDEAIAVYRQDFKPHADCLVRAHSSCVTGDLFSSLRCDCGDQLTLAMQQIVEQNGVLLYLPQEGRGIGLANKIKAYQLQDQGLDTVEANLKLGFEPDERDFAMAAQMLKILQLPSIQLLTNNPQKVKQLQQYGITVSQRIALHTESKQENLHYLKTKQDKFSHDLSI